MHLGGGLLYLSEIVKKMMKKALFTSSLALFAATAFFLTSCAQNAFYYPDNVDYGSPMQQGLTYQSLEFTSKDGTTLHGWFVPAKGLQNPKDALGTVVHFHGNAQNLSAHWHGVKWLPEQGFNVFLFDYRGYGKSAGKPSQQGLFDDGNAALDYVRQRADVDANKLLIFGQSLGGTNAIAVVGAGNRAGVKAVAIESTFSAYSDIANDKISGAGILLRDTYSANRYVDKIAPIPLLLLHGTHDSVIPHSHSQTLYDLAQEPKRLIIIKGGQHLNLPAVEPNYQQILLQFFREHL